jgi:TPR repeat protein
MQLTNVGQLGPIRLSLVTEQPMSVLWLCDQEMPFVPMSFLDPEETASFAELLRQGLEVCARQPKGFNQVIGQLPPRPRVVQLESANLEGAEPSLWIRIFDGCREFLELPFEPEQIKDLANAVEHAVQAIQRLPFERGEVLQVDHSSVRLRLADNQDHSLRLADEISHGVGPYREFFRPEELKVGDLVHFCATDSTLLRVLLKPVPRPSLPSVRSPELEALLRLGEEGELLVDNGLFAAAFDSQRPVLTTSFEGLDGWVAHYLVGKATLSLLYRKIMAGQLPEAARVWARLMPDTTLSVGQESLERGEVRPRDRVLYGLLTAHLWSFHPHLKTAALQLTRVSEQAAREAIDIDQALLAIVLRNWRLALERLFPEEVPGELRQVWFECSRRCDRRLSPRVPFFPSPGSWSLEGLSPMPDGAYVSPMEGRAAVLDGLARELYGAQPADPQKSQAPSLHIEVDLSPFTSGVSRGLSAYQKGAVLEAKEIWKAEAQAGNAEAQHNLGLLLHEQGDFEEAVRWYESAVQLGSLDSLGNLAAMVFAGQGVQQDLPRAKELFEQAARRGLDGAQFTLAQLYLKGVAIEADPALAKHWLAKAAEQNHSQAQHILGALLLDENADDEAVGWFLRSANLGYAPAQHALGMHFYFGLREAEQAAAWFAKAAQGGHADAQCRLGALYEMGAGLPKDLERAAFWFRQAAEQGDARGMCLLGNLCEPTEGLAWYLRAAEAGDPGGAFNLGLALLRGATAERDPKAAAPWLAQAANAGNPVAACVLGELLAEGDGLPQDTAAAAHYFAMAAQLGHPEAQYHLGYCYFEGQGVEPDMAAAARWFSASAEQGYAPAQYSIGVLYYQGDGVPEDLSEAVRWFRLAAGQGDPRAAHNLKALGY